MSFVIVSASNSRFAIKFLHFDVFILYVRNFLSKGKKFLLIFFLYRVSIVTSLYISKMKRSCYKAASCNVKEFKARHVTPSRYILPIPRLGNIHLHFLENWFRVREHGLDRRKISGRALANAREHSRIAYSWNKTRVYREDVLRCITAVEKKVKNLCIFHAVTRFPKNWNKAYLSSTRLSSSTRLMSLNRVQGLRASV